MTTDPVGALRAFSSAEFVRAKQLLATRVAQMMGRKLEEDDWHWVYCNAKEIPYSGWSNLYIDVSHGGLGVEQKLLRVPRLKGRSIKSVCGTTLMHPSATRSIRIADTEASAQKVMRDVFRQYSELLVARSKRVQETATDADVDVRVGWLLWERGLTEFLYFEEPMIAPDPSAYFAEWNITPPRGTRKGSKSLWIYEKNSNKKRFSVTTSAGVKIQPYFDVPAPTDENLYYFRVQSEPIGADTVQIWVSDYTAATLRRELGGLGKEHVSQAVIRAAKEYPVERDVASPEIALAQPIQLSEEAFRIFQAAWSGVNDEHRAQLFLKSLLKA